MSPSLLQSLSLILLLCTPALFQESDPPQTSLELNKLLNLTNIPTGYTYYSVNFMLKPEQARLFLVTVETQQAETIEIFTSVYYEGVQEYFKYPTYQNNSNACAYSSIDTCAVALPQVKQGQVLNVTVYIGVELFFTDQMSIMAMLEDLYEFHIGIKYDIDFAVWESAVFTLEAEDVNEHEQLIVQMQYDVFKGMGKFAMYAGVDQIPSGYPNRIQSKYMGAFTQILILDPLEANQTYYIVLQGEQGSQFDVVIKPFSTSSPKLVMNETVYYYSAGSGQRDHDEMLFWMAINYAAEDDVLPILVDLNSLGGYGQFAVDYCDGLTNFTFENVNGESGEVVIPVEERKQCYDYIKTSGSLMVENLIVGIRSVPWYFSFSIGVFEGDYPVLLTPYSEKMGTLIASQPSRVYDIQGYINQSFVLKFKTVSGEEKLNFTVRECKIGLLGRESCKAIRDSNVDGVIDPNDPEYKQFKFTSLERKTYKLQVTHGSFQKFDSEYVLLLLPNKPHPTLLTPSRPVTSIIQKNQYQYYFINLTLISQQSNITIDNNTDILITMIQKNGACIMLTSLTQAAPKFDQVFEQNSTVDYSWNGKRQYNVDGSVEAIYVGVLGEKESLYHLQVSVQANQDTPQSYVKLVSDKILSFNLSSELKQDHILLSYTAHSIPYTIIISPSPACVAYSYTLPFDNTACRELPSEITSKTIYLKVYRKVDASKDEGDFKFVVYVYSGTHYLFQYTPVMIACKDACFEYVTVFAPQPIKIVHQGMGYIALKNSELVYSNQKMDITCEKGYPCFLTINASLPWGGNLELFYDSIDAQEIQWMNKPLTFASPSDPKLFYMQIRSWNSLNTAIFYTEGLTVTVYYNIYSMRENATNALEYGFPNTLKFDKKSVGNPLRRFHIVEFDEKLIEQLGCKDENDLCIATLAVYANTFGDYSSEYVNKSIGYYSCNTYEYYAPMNAPYQLSEEYSLVYFSHDLSEEERANLAPKYYVRVEPLSSCRPQIFAPFSQNADNVSFAKDMPYYGLYTIDSKTLNEKNPEIEFSISTDTPCEYTLWLLDTQLPPVIQNKNYEFTSDSNGAITFVYSDKYLWTNKKFTVSFDKQVSEILIAKYQRYPNGSVKIPTSNASLASATQTKQLSYNSEEYLSTLYIIRASTNVSTKLNIKILTHQSYTTLMTNQVQKLTFSQDSYELTYRYFSNSDFLIFATTDSGTVRITVTDYKRDEDRNVVEMSITENSQPWIKVNAVKNDIREYVITLRNVLLMNGRNLQAGDTKYPRVTLHIEETGTVGLPQLFDGVALFDAFYSDDAQNCYKYISEPIVGRPSLSVSLVFGSDMINSVGDVKSRVMIGEGESRVNFTSKSLPTGLRIETTYSSDQVYAICFAINEQQALVGKQFYVMVQNLEYSLKHITLDVPVSEINPGTYQIYQYVATEDQNLMIEVVNCFGKPTLLGAQNYEDIYLGQVSQLGSFYRDNTLSVASKQIGMGYFYFALKQDQETDRYKIRLQLMEENQTLHYDKFELKQKTILKAKTVEENGRQKVRVNMPPISMKDLPAEVKVHHVTYNLLVDNLKEQQQYSSNIIAKCPILASRNLSSYKFVQNVSQSSIKLNTLTEDDIRIDVPSSQIPQHFNLTGYVQVSISEPYTQTLTFYYQSSNFKLKNTYVVSNGGVGAFTIVFVMFLILGTLVVVYVVYRRWRMKRQGANVDFQMANYNYDATAQNNVTQKETQKNVPSNNESPSKSLKKALNQNTGYGEFIDESV